MKAVESIPVNLVRLNDTLVVGQTECRVHALHRLNSSVLIVLALPNGRFDSIIRLHTEQVNRLASTVAER